MAEENRHTTYEQEGSDEIKSRGMFDFLSKKEEEKPQEEVLVTEFEKVQVSEEPYEKEKPCEKEEEVKGKKPGLKEKLHRSTSSSSSVRKKKKSPICYFPILLFGFSFFFLVLV